MAVTSSVPLPSSSPLKAANCPAAPSVIPDLPDPVMFKKRRLFRAIGVMNVIIALGGIMMALVILRSAPWGSPLFVIGVIGVYIVYYWTFPAKKTNVYYGPSWRTSVKIREKTLRPLPGGGKDKSNSNSSDCGQLFRVGPHSDFITRTLKTIPTLKGRGYKPTFYFESPSVQTVYATAFRADPLVYYDREVVTHLYSDGEACILDWSFSPLANDGLTSPKDRPTSSNNEGNRKPPAPVVVIFHGLTGGSDDCNVHYTTKILNDNGFHVVIPVRRGCADAANLISRNKHYPYGDEADTLLAVNYIAKKMEGHWLLGVGISAGSNVLAMYLGLQGNKSKLRAGISIANGYDWNKGTEDLVRIPFWSTLMASMVQYNLLRRHDTKVFFNPEHALVDAKKNNQQEKVEYTVAGAQSTKKASSSSSRGGSDTLFVETHDLNQIRGLTSVAATVVSNFQQREAGSVVTENPHPFVDALIQSATAARRLVARTVTHTQLAATYFVGGEDDVVENENENEENDDDEEEDQNALEEGEEGDDVPQTTTPFPYPFDPDRFLPPQRKRRAIARPAVAAAAARDDAAEPRHQQQSHTGHHHNPSSTAEHVSSIAKVVGALYSEYSSAYDREQHLQRLRSSTTTDASELMAALMSTPTSTTAPTTTIRPSSQGGAGAKGQKGLMGLIPSVLYNNRANQASTSSSSPPATSNRHQLLNEQVAFEKAVRSGLRGRLNAEFEEETARALEVAAAASFTFGASISQSITCDNVLVSQKGMNARANEAIKATAAVPLALANAHHKRAAAERYTRCGDEVVLKENYAHIRDYDELVTRRLHGYHDVRTYYDAQSSRHVLRNITVPTFFLNALDDPVASPEALPYRELASNPNTCLITTPRGGHLGWADGLWPFPTSYHSWLERFVKEIAIMIKDEVEAGRL